MVLAIAVTLLLTGACTRHRDSSELFPFPWDSIESSPGSRTLTVHYTGGKCGKFEKVTTKSSDHQVIVTIWLRAVPSPTNSCFAVGIPGSTQVTLDRPLGHRVLVNGGCATHRRLVVCQLPGQPIPLPSTAP
jgi:hypothetical protein